MPCDILIVKVGENVIDDRHFKVELKKLVDFYRQKHTKVLIVSTAIRYYWTEKDEMMKVLCQEEGYVFVDLIGMQADQSNFAWNEWENASIGCHPSDKGMYYIAQKIMEKI